MPEINQTVGVILFGREPTEKLPEVIRYMNNALDHGQWSDFLFLNIMPADSQDRLQIQLPAGIPVRGRTHSWRPGDGVDAGFVSDIRYRLTSHSELTLFIICGDFESGMLPPTLPADYLAGIRSQFPTLTVEAKMFLVCHTGREARLRQFELAGCLHEKGMDRDGSTLVLPMSTLVGRGASVHDFTIWRALSMMLLCTAWNAFRGMDMSQCYSLGYASLNAEDRELVQLRETAVKQELSALASAPMTEGEAWELLTGEKPADELMMDPSRMQEYVFNWLRRLADRYLLHATEQELDQVQILSGVKNPSQVGSALVSFYAANYSTAGQENGLPGKIALNRILEKTKLQLMNSRCVPNGARFPMPFFQEFLHGLKNAAEKKIAYPRVNTDSAKGGFLKILTPRGKEIRSAFDSCHQEIRNNFRDYFCVRLAARLIPEYSYHYQVMNYITRRGDLKELLRYDEDEFAELSVTKWKGYWESIESARQVCRASLFGNNWFDPGSANTRADREHPIYDENGELLTADVDGFLKAAAELLKSNLKDQDTSLIHVLKNETEAGNADTMPRFLDNYLGKHPCMFSWIAKSGDPREVCGLFVIDQKLANIQWVAEQRNKILSRTDNVEKLVLYDLRSSLEDMLQGDSLFDCLLRPETGDRQTWGSSVLWQSDGSAENTADVKKPERPAAEDRRELITCTTSGKQIHVSWVWPEGISLMRYKINEEEILPVDRAAYGSGVDGKARPGKNVVILYYMNGSEYARCSCPGIQTLVACRVPRSGEEAEFSYAMPKNQQNSDRTGGVDGHEIEKDGLVQLGILASRKSRQKEQVDQICYPVCLDGTPDKEDRVRISFKKLNLGGQPEVISLPTVPYPTMVRK